MRIEVDRKAIVTGGASGFGLGVARGLADAGAAVAIADLNHAALEAASAQDPRLVPLTVDVTAAESVRRAVEHAAERFSGLDTLVICAGIIHIKPLEEVTESDWDSTLAVNLKGAFLACQAAAEWLKSSGRGRIVAISSDAGKKGWPGLQAYTASKFGLIGLCESVGAELAPHGVTVNCVCPSSCPTTGMGQSLTKWKADQTQRSVDDVLEDIAASFPLGRYVEIEDVVNAILFLISAEASLLTGLAIDVDGGMHLGGAVPGAEVAQEAAS
jgi:NAD(P)-dependent dehydrogenase (short-subunit alcohol dehydrogenase family)